jgi:pyruvate dehydrogenase E2 component (dihydrolipoamide acetyltransferase)
MAFEITVPRLGWSMEEGTFVRWLKKDGETVRPGDPLFELEGEKAAQDIEAVDGGILRIPPTAPSPGTVVAVGAVIGYLTSQDEAMPHAASATSASEPTRSTLVAPIASAVSVTATPAAPPSVRRRAREMGLQLSQIAGSGPAGRITVEDLQQLAPLVASSVKSAAKVASPRARRVARDLGVDWTRVTGTGRDGRIREQDVRAFQSSPGQPAARRLIPNSNTSARGVKTPITRHRRAVADRMMYSRQNTAPVTLTTRIDATNLVSLRQQFKSAGDSVVPSYSDIVIKLTAIILEQHPQAMTRWDADQLTIPDVISIGMAVETSAGLLVPVLSDVSSLSLMELAKMSSQLVTRARDGQLKASDMQDAVFTVTNLGAYGIDGFTPIINSPESAILGLGRIRREPAVVDNQIVPRDQMTLSLTFDHRVMDGAPAAAFLQTIGQAIESPSAWLLRSAR